MRSSVKDFYQYDKISRVSPGMKDSRMFIIDGKRRRKQLRHMVMNIKEAHAIFCEDNPEVKIGLTCFQQLRPPFVRYSSEIPHNVCVCSIHENIRLKLASLNPGLLQDVDELLSPSSYIKLITCSRSSEACMSRTCEVCALKELKFSEEKGQQETTFYEWGGRLITHEWRR